MGGVGRRRGGGFLPTKLSATAQLKIWLDAQDTSTLFQSIAGTGAVASDGDVVGYWGDKSGNAFHFKAAADNTTRPAFKVNRIGTKNTILFDNSNDLLQCTETGAVGISRNKSIITEFVVVRNLGTAEFVTFFTNSGGSRFQGLVSATTMFLNGKRIDAEAFKQINSGSTLGAANYYLTFQIDFSTSTGTGRTYKNGTLINGSQNMAFDATGSPVATADTDSNMGPKIPNVATTAPEVAEIVVCTGPLSAGELTSMHNYLAAKYSL